MIKALLLVGGKRYDVTDDLKNWDETEISAKRKDFGGVVRSFGNKFEFVKDAYTLLENEYLTNYTKASAVIIIGVLNNEWTYNEKFRCQLDFSTYQSDGTTLTMNAIDDSIAAVISANKSQVYDIPVEELKSQELYYDRMELKNSVEYYLNPDSDKIEEEENIGIINDSSIRISLPIGYGTVNFPIKNIIETGDQYGIWEASNSRGEGKFFVRAYNSSTININLSFFSKAEFRLESNNVWVIQLIKWIGSNDEIIYQERLGLNEWKEISYLNNIDLKAGEELSLTIVRGSTVPPGEGQDNDNADIKIKKFYLSVNYTGKDKPVKIDAFTPQKLLTSILHKMGLTNVTGVIEEGSIAIPWMLAAESIRGFKTAKVHTSFNKFTDFARAVLGYDYQIEENRVVFKHLSKFYDSKQVKELEYVNGLDLSINESLIYSGVDVGYDKKDYDEINGRDEFHFTNSFSTGLSINDNVLKLISPYRADCYGIEFLANKRDEETKDDSSDNDLFIVNARLHVSNSFLILDRLWGRPTGVLFPDSVFNIAYSPRRMLLANKMYIGACTNRLTYTASNGNADVVLNGISEKESIDITDQERLFRIETIKVETIGLSPFPGNYHGIVTFNYAGRNYEGYVTDINEMLGKSQTTSYSFICRKIE